MLKLTKPSCNKEGDYVALQASDTPIPGDVLFIPALWFHNVVAHDFSVAVNVFWRHLPKELFEEKDTYGNRDPIPAARAMMSLATALKALKSLPTGQHK